MDTLTQLEQLAPRLARVVGDNTPDHSTGRRHATCSPDHLRDGQTFAAAVQPAPDATPIERLAAYTGRRPLASREER
jgi:hypothetical protein